MNAIRSIFITLLLLCPFASIWAQKAAVKTNILYDATLTLNAAAEIKTAPKWTVELSGNLNAWSVGHRNWRQWMLMPEARYWFCETFSGHFVGAHILGGQYNFGHLNMDFNMLGTDFGKLRDYRYQGWMGGAGVAYGYSWILNRNWNLEAEFGFGWVYTRYDQFECHDCGQRVRRNHPHNYVGPTKAAINLVYTF